MLFYIYTHAKLFWEVIFLRQICIDMLKKCIMSIPPGQDGVSWTGQFSRIMLIFKMATILDLYFHTLKPDPTLQLI